MQGQISNTRVHGRGQGGDHPCVAIATEGGMALAGSLAEFGRFIADETEEWAKVIRAANIIAE